MIDRRNALTAFLSRGGIFCSCLWRGGGVHGNTVAGVKNFLAVLSLSLLFSLTVPSVRALDADTDLDAAISLATKEHKSLFIIYGCTTCKNTKHLLTSLESQEIRLPRAAFIVVSLNKNIPGQRKSFLGRYKVTGDVLPYVVIARPDGKQVAMRTGYGSAGAYNDFIRDACHDLKKTH